MAGPFRTGLDLGGTETEAAALGSAGQFLACTRAPTPAHDDAGTLRPVRHRAAGLESRLGREATIGIGMPGVASPATDLIQPATNLIKKVNSTWLNDETGVRGAAGPWPAKAAP